MSYPSTLLLLLLPLVSATYDVQYVNPVTLFWVNCYDVATCSVWQACPETTAQTVCIKYAANAPAYYTSGANAVGFGNVTDAYQVLTMTIQTSYSFSSGKTDNPPALSFSSVPFIVTPSCLSELDTILNPDCPTTTFYQTNNFRDLPPSHFCLAAMQGFGSLYNTICEPYATLLSNYYTINQPTGNVFTDFGTPRARRTLGCYWENWARYRPAPYVSELSDLAGCDTIYYFVNTFQDRQGNIAFVEREEGDWDIMRTIRTTYPTAELVLTFGGWVSNNTLIHQVFTTHRDIIMPQVYQLATDIGFGLDFDVEFPGGRNNFPDIFPLDIPLITDFMTGVCTFTRSINQRCFWGGLGVGVHYHPDLISALSSAGVDQFNMFGYDLHGPWEPTMNHQNPLDPVSGEFSNYTLVQTVSNFASILPLTKFSLGFPIYGRGAVVDASGTVIGNFPTESPMLAPGEYGSDLIVSVDGVEQPAIYDSATDTITESPEGYYILSRPLDSGTGVLYFSNSTTFRRITSRLLPLGVTSYFTYASTMSRVASQRLNNVLKNSQRTRRSVNTVYYQFPAPDGGVIDCPGIVAFTDHIVVSTTNYDGCLKAPDSQLCFFDRASFTCQQSDQYSSLPPSNGTCSGINLNTLLPAQPDDVFVVCDQLTIKTATISLCPAPPPDQPTTLLDIQVPSDQLDWPIYHMPVHTAFDPTTDAIELPYTCDDVPRIPPCAELLCGLDTACFALIQTPAMSQFCDSLSFAIASYHQALDEYAAEHSTLTSLFDELSQNAVHSFGTPPDPTRNRRALGGFGFGFGILGSIFGGIALGFSVENREDINEIRSDVSALRDVTAENFDRIESAFGDFRDTTVDALREQANINQAFDNNFKSLTETLTTNFAGVTSKFAEIDQALSSVVSTVNSLSDDLAQTKVLHASALSAVARIQAATQLLTSSRFALSSATSQVRSCLISVRSDSLTGCVSMGSGSVPLSVKPYVNGPTKGLVFFYLQRSTIGTAAFRSTTSFCNATHVITSASGCRFFSNLTTITHLDQHQQPCEAPLAYPVQQCPASVALLSSSEPSTQFAFTPFSFAVPPSMPIILDLTNFTADTDFNLTSYNASAFNALIDRIARLELELLDVPEVQTQAHISVWVIVAMALASAGVLFGFVSTFYTCSLGSSFQKAVSKAK